MEPNLINKASRIAYDAHKGQFRWESRGVSEPFITHPKRIASYMPDEDGQIVAWLHDVIEDTNITLADLHNASFPSYIIDAVSAITHWSGESYEDYLQKVISDPIARRVKIADVAYNLVSLMTDFPEKIKKIKKYKKALDYLI